MVLKLLICQNYNCVQSLLGRDKIIDSRRLYPTMTTIFIKRLFLFFTFAYFLYNNLYAQSQNASLKINAGVVYQKITGFGGFVNSGTFGYNHMSEAEIRKMWGKESEAGYNIMRLYLPTGESNWPQALNTFKLAKSLGLKIFASPWSMPTQWKTYNTTASVYTENGVKYDVSLKEENYLDYANYLNNFVIYLRNNGVELDAISLQNEPDMKVEYAGCLWTPAQMAKFIKDYAHLISCPVMAPEGVGITDNYATALLDPAVLANFEIFAGHQYSYIQPGLKNIQAQGKDVWMTEYLINWNSDENTSRNFNWTQDAFNFAGKVNEALVANVNAWIHYATKRFYGLMGDGTFGTTNGAMTKRGYILSQYAKYIIGTKRVESVWSDASNVLQGSSYFSTSGDTVTVVIINPSTNPYSLTVDLPFLSFGGKMITTSETLNLSETPLSVNEETSRPRVNIGASSVSTLIFVKSNDRVVSQMTGETIFYDKIESQPVTNTSFGTNYMLSGRTVTFKNDVPLISTFTNNSSGYLKLNERFNKMVMHVESVSSTSGYTSSNTTLYYINSSGAVKSYNYGTVNLDKKTNFDIVLDISTNVLTDGCIGVLSIKNSNFSSVLTIKFGNVYFALGNEKGYKFTGVYSKDDSNLLDCFENPGYTSLDFRATSGITSDVDWRASVSNKNCVFYSESSDVANKKNVVAGVACASLELSDAFGDFYSPVNFTATSASYQCTINGYKIVVLPFSATIPEGTTAYNLEILSGSVSASVITNGIISANTPVLVKGSGLFIFSGTGAVSSPRSLKVNNFSGVYVSTIAPLGSYYLKTENGTTFFQRSVAGSQPVMTAFSAYIAQDPSLSGPSLSLLFDNSVIVSKTYNFENDIPTTSASTPPATNISIATDNTATMGVTTFTNASSQTSKVLRAYSGGNRNGTGVADLNQFPASSDYSVTWKQSNASASTEYKVGCLLRASGSAGTSTTGYTQGLLNGYLFIVYNAGTARTEFRIYRSTSEISLSTLVSTTVASHLPASNQSVWYRASAIGSTSVSLKLEYSTDSITWTNGAVATDASASPFMSGTTQLVWGLGSPGYSFYLDNITYRAKTVVLPIQLASFSAKFEKGIVNLKWSTFSEKDNLGFELERSINGNLFEKIGFFKGSENNYGEKWYNTVDNSPNIGVNYYRLKQIDANGAVSYSPVEAVFASFNKDIVKLYPNPVVDLITVESLTDGTLVVLNASGQVVLKIAILEGKNLINVSKLNSGFYFYVLNSNRGSFIKQ